MHFCGGGADHNTGVVIKRSDGVAIKHHLNKMKEDGKEVCPFSFSSVVCATLLTCCGMKSWGKPVLHSCFFGKVPPQLKSILNKSVCVSTG